MRNFMPTQFHNGYAVSESMDLRQSFCVGENKVNINTRDI